MEALLGVLSLSDAARKALVQESVKPPSNWYTYGEATRRLTCHLTLVLRVQLFLETSHRSPQWIDQIYAWYWLDQNEELQHD